MQSSSFQAAVAQSSQCGAESSTTSCVAHACQSTFHSFHPISLSSTFSPFTMPASWSSAAFSVILLLTTQAEAQRKPFITTEAEVITECKTCPRSLCTNLDTYSQSYGAFNVTCWTRGTKIMSDDLWLKTDKGCFVTQYDVLEYPGDCTSTVSNRF
jgi:hypothetical protein